MYRLRTKYGLETYHWLSMPLPSTVGQKTKKWWSKFVKQTVSFKSDQKLRQSDLMEGKNHKRYPYGNKIRSQFSVSKMAAELAAVLVIHYRKVMLDILREISTWEKSRYFTDSNLF